MANPEIPNNNNYIDALKLKRFQFRINDVRNNLRKLLENSLAQNCDLSFLRGIENNLVTDESNPTISTLATLEVLGLRQDVFRYLSQSTNSDEYTIFNLVANEWIELAPLNKGFSFTSSNLQNTISFTRNALGELNTNKAIDYLLKRSGSRFETEISDIEIDLEDEALFLLGILSSLGINIIHIDDVSEILKS